jgi:hypothetical protein
MGVIPSVPQMPVPQMPSRKCPVPQMPAQMPDLAKSLRSFMIAHDDLRQDMRPTIATQWFIETKILRDKGDFKREAKTMTYWPASEQFLFNSAGAVIGGSLVAWLSGYYSEKGKRKLMREEWPNLLAEAHEKAYEEERAKRIATKDDIESVVEQVKRVTEATETTKAEITGGLWERQWQFAQKRDVYVRLIDALELMRIEGGKLKRSGDEKKEAEAQRAGLEAIEEFRRARVLAELLLARETVVATHQIVRFVRPFFLATSSESRERSRAMQVIDKARKRIAEIGRADLGLSKTADWKDSANSATLSDTL